MTTAPARFRPCSSAQTREDVVHGIDDVLGAVVARLALRTLRGVAADGQRRIDQQVEPVGGLLHLRAALRPDRAQIVSARQNALHVVGDFRQHRPRRRCCNVIRLVREKMLAADFRSDVARPDVGAAGLRQSLGVAARRRNPEEIDRCLRRDRAARPVRHDRQTVDFLEAARTVGEEALARHRRGSSRCCTFLFPGLAIGLDRHVGQRIEAILRVELDLVHSLVGGGCAVLVERSVGADVAVGRTVELLRIGLERMGGELLHIKRRRRSKPLRSQRIERGDRAVRIAQRRQLASCPRLVRCHERRRVLDRRRRSGQMRNSRLAVCCHLSLLRHCRA